MTEGIPDPNEPLLTEWTRIEGRDFEHFFRKYWGPVRRFVGRRLPISEEPEEVTQELFFAFLERDFLGRADARKGSFRKFLFHAARQFLIDRHRAVMAQKRGGGRIVSLESAPGVGSHDDQSEQSFDREWYASLFNRARKAVKSHYYRRERPEFYRTFRLFYFGDGGPEKWTQKRIASELDLTISQVKNFVHRAKGVFSREIRKAVADYVTREEEVEEELQDLSKFLENHRLQGPPPTSIGAEPADFDF